MISTEPKYSTIIKENLMRIREFMYYFNSKEYLQNFYFIILARI